MRRAAGSANCRPRPCLVIDLAGSNLVELFEKHFGGSVTRNYEWPDDGRGRLRETSAALRYWACNGTTEEPHALRLGESRIHETDEAWISVITPDGPGVLVWFNSD
ncbi:DUF6210 family protein [Kitasatospora indigofera]|uniref:DUF6210 family protein n=1 Tax=Kitasatospora indigofera TaxID=67307 RepID=UPI00362F36CC